MTDGIYQKISLNFAFKSAQIDGSFISLQDEESVPVTNQ